jgi:hypothetical protein
VAENREISAKKQIRNLLTLIAASISSAVIIAFGVAYYYGPSGLYQAKNITFPPDFFSDLKYYASGPKGKQSSAFIFDAIIFSYFDEGKKEWENISLTLDQYKQIYNLFYNDESVETVTEEVKEQFTTNYFVSIYLRVRIDTSLESEASVKTFQEINIVNHGDYYRIEVHEEGSQNNWVYFYHPSIYDEVMKVVFKKDLNTARTL